jgi:hypothetical protein
MPGRIYISCDVAERTHPRVQALCGSLKELACEPQFAPFTTTWCGYSALEEAIEQADAFVAVVGAGYQSSMWLNHELSYAFALSCSRTNRLPRLFGLRLASHNLPRCSEHIALKWINATCFKTMLADLS